MMDLCCKTCQWCLPSTSCHTHQQMHPPTQTHPPTLTHPPTQAHHLQTHPSTMTQRTDNLTPYSKKENANHQHNFKSFLPKWKSLRQHTHTQAEFVLYAVGSILLRVSGKLIRGWGVIGNPYTSHGPMPNVLVGVTWTQMTLLNGHTSAQSASHKIASMFFICIARQVPVGCCQQAVYIHLDLVASPLMYIFMF